MIDFNSKEELIEFKTGLMSGLNLYYEERIEELKTERERTEVILKRDLHRMNLILLGLIVFMFMVVVSVTVLLYGATIELDTSSCSDSYGVIEDNNFNEGDLNIDGIQINNEDGGIEDEDSIKE